MEEIKVCFDIGGTFIKYGIFSKDNQWLYKGSFPTDITNVDNFFLPMVSLIKELQTNYDIQGIAMSFPGFVNTESGEAILAGAIVPLNGCNIREAFLYRLGERYPIWIENDANCAALAEISNGNAKGLEEVVLITLGTGIGGAIVQGGRLIRGSQFRAGEFGMMVTDYRMSGFKTLHELASTSALVRQYRELHGISDSVQVKGEEIFSRLDESETAALVSEWAMFVALTIFNIVTTLNPQKLLIGGGISQNEQLLPIIQQALEKHPNWKDFFVPIETCRYYNDSGILGALYLIETNGGEK